MSRTIANAMVAMTAASKMPATKAPHTSARDGPGLSVAGGRAPGSVTSGGEEAAGGCTFFQNVVDPRADHFLPLRMREDVEAIVLNGIDHARRDLSWL